MKFNREPVRHRTEVIHPSRYWKMLRTWRKTKSCITNLLWHDFCMQIRNANGKKKYCILENDKCPILSDDGRLAYLFFVYMSNHSCFSAVTNDELHGFCWRIEWVLCHEHNVQTRVPMCGRAFRNPDCTERTTKSNEQFLWSFFFFCMCSYLFRFYRHRRTVDCLEFSGLRASNSSSAISLEWFIELWCVSLSRSIFVIFFLTRLWSIIAIETKNSNIGTSSNSGLLKAK